MYYLIMSQVNNYEVIIREGNVRLIKTVKVTYVWDSCLITGKHDPTFKLLFRDAYEITHKHSDEDIDDCVYQINGREFKGISFKEGEILQKLDEEHEIRQYPDGTKFLLYREDIPTFDSYDRMLDSRKYVAVYRDNNEINLIDCHCGYIIGHINIYLGLKEVPPEFSNLLKLL